MTTVDKNKARRFVFDPDDMTAILESVVLKHGTHNQKTHAGKRGGGGAKFFEAGGEITSPLGSDSAELAEMVETVDLMSDVLGDGFASDTGVKFTRNAMDIEGEPEDTMVEVAFTEDGVAGAIQYTEMSQEMADFTSEDFLDDTDFKVEPHIYISYLGSTGLVDRAGSALAESVLRKAAAKGIGVYLQSKDAASTAFWERLGMKKAPDGLLLDIGVSITHTLSASEVQELVDNL